MVEIHSPGDEAYEKLPFYAELGVPELWIVHRDTRRPELYVLRDSKWEQQTPAANGWLQSPATGVALCGVPINKIAIRMAADHATTREWPEE